MLENFDNDEQNKPDDNESAKEDYEVGYKRPPIEHQFRPGQSGNPKGKAKSKPVVRNFEADFRNAMKKVIPVQEGGKTKQITIQEALFQVLYAKALKGHMGAIKLLLNIAAKLPPEKTAFATLNEAMEAIRVNLIKSKEEGSLPPDLEDINPSEFLPIPELKPRKW